MGLLWIAVYADAKQSTNGDTKIKQEIIEQSIANYSGNCPCPYNTASNGSRCGKRSAYNRVGGDAPICYPEDVTEKMIQQYRK